MISLDKILDITLTLGIIIIFIGVVIKYIKNIFQENKEVELELAKQKLKEQQQK